MITPVTPSEVKEQAGSHIPDEVIECVNALLLAGTRAFGHDKIIEAIQRKVPNVSRSEIFKWNWLDFEPVFRKAGWSVDYDKPAYNESYEATWTFREKK